VHFFVLSASEASPSARTRQRCLPSRAFAGPELEMPLQVLVETAFVACWTLHHCGRHGSCLRFCFLWAQSGLALGALHLGLQVHVVEVRWGLTGCEVRVGLLPPVARLQHLHVSSRTCPDCGNLCSWVNLNDEEPEAPGLLIMIHASCVSAR
jgi:hypothetical protein